MKPVFDVKPVPQDSSALASGDSQELPVSEAAAVALGAPRHTLARSVWLKGRTVAWGAPGEPPSEAWTFLNSDDAEDFVCVMGQRPADADFLAAVALFTDLDLGLLAFRYKNGALPGVLRWLERHRGDVKKAIEVAQLRMLCPPALPAE